MQDILLFMQQHSSYTLALCVVLAILILLEFIKQKGGYASLSTAQATHLINRENAVILDVRNTDAYDNGHIVEAVSLPAADIEDKLKKLEKFRNQPIIVVCETGTTESQKAAAILRKNGFDARLLAGGLRSWKTDQLPLVKSK